MAFSQKQQARSLLSVEHLSIDISHEHHIQRVVDDLNFTLYAGGTLCIPGESGSGKSLSSLAIMGLLPKVARLPSGVIRYGRTCWRCRSGPCSACADARSP